MATVTVLISVFDVTDPAAPKGPAGVLPGLYRYKIIDGSGATVQSHDNAALGFTFNDVAPGSYTAFAEILDSTGAEVPGMPTQSAPFEVVAQPVGFPAPTGITVTLVG
jgi:hypothetical protein